VVELAPALEVGYELTQTGLTVRITATNSGESPLPYGAGNHPYLTAGTPKVDPATLQLPADAYYETDDRLLPQRRASVEGTEYDFREARPIGETRLDTCFTGLAHDPDGRARAYLRDPATGRGVEVWMDESYRYLQVFTGDTLPGEKYRSAVAIEPMTCAPDAFNSGDGLVVLEPGESFTSAWGMDVLT
jgi:aldose 1-epimerase